jgi:hypothetical protein
MTKWLELVFRGGLGLLQGILRDAVAKISVQDVEGAKSEVKEAIQRHRGLPGTLRRWLCQEVDAINAASITEFRARLDEEIARLTI